MYFKFARISQSIGNFRTSTNRLKLGADENYLNNTYKLTGEQLKEE